MDSRRRLLKFSAAFCAASLSRCSVFAEEHAAPEIKNPLCVFTKPFNSLTADQIAQQTARLGLQGIEAPIRAGGHIAPVAVKDQLPAFVESLREHGQEILILTSDINDPNDKLSREVLETAAGLGIRYYRMNYFRYDESRPVAAQIRNWRSQMIDLAALNHQLGITALYQNHAGRNYFGAAIWDLERGLDGIDPTQVGVAYDIRHATAEASASWPIGFRLIQPRIQAVYVKDFDWGQKQGVINVPLGQGRVDSAFFQMLAKTDFAGPISLHEEYLDHRQPELVPAHWAAIEADLKTLRGWLERV